MVEKAAAYIKRHHMIEQGDHVIVGVSGGADSVCLFFILKELRHRIGFSMSVMHIEHGIRGEESLLDMHFVNQLADRYKIPFACRRYPVKELAKKQGISLEEAGRNIRYEAFAKEERRFAKQY